MAEVPAHAISTPAAGVSLDSESDLIGACLLSREGVRSAATVEAADFYNPTHGLIFAAVRTLYEDGSAIDVSTVAAQLDRDGNLGRVGGRATLLRIQASTPASANAVFYAEEVARGGALRRAQALGGEIVGAARARDLDAVETLLQAGTERVSAPLGRVIPGEDLSQIMAVEHPEPRWVIPRTLARRDRLIITGEEGFGKLLAVDTPIPTMLGWRKLGEIRPGEFVFDDLGQPTEVVAATDVDESHPCFRVRFDDGSSLVAADTHLWRTVDYRGRQGEGKGHVIPRWGHTIRSTADIAETLYVTHGKTKKVNHAIECCGAVRYGTRFDLPVDPYVLGYWLGNGTTGCGIFTTGGAGVEDDTAWIVARLVAAGYECRARKYAEKLGHRVSVKKLSGQLRSLDVLHKKRIPEAYLRASVDQRLALAQGLLDSDGYIRGVTEEKRRGNGAASIEWCSCASVGEPNLLADDMIDLLHGLGIKLGAQMSEATLYGRVTSIRTRVMFQTDLPVFSLPRKADRLGELRSRRAKTRYVVAADPVDPVPCVCIQVAAPSGMYLCGESCIPTHNSTIIRMVGIQVACGVHPWELSVMDRARVLHVDMENSPEQAAAEYAKIATPAVRRRYEPGWLAVKYRPQGLDLTRRADQRWLEALLAHHQPDLLSIGPLYKMMRGTERRSIHSEESAAEAAFTLDELRQAYDVALIIEAHSPHITPGAKKREVRPIGASLWLRWPEFGWGLVQGNDGQARVERWRRDRVRGRVWPSELVQGGPMWPWTVPEVM